MENYLLIVSWVIFTSTIVVFPFRIYGFVMYHDSRQQMRDRINGVKRTWHIRNLSLAFIFSGSFLLSHYFM